MQFVLRDPPPIGLCDYQVDMLSEDQRDRLVIASLRAQVEFAVKNVAFWRDRLSRFRSLKYFGFDYPSFIQIPVLTKEVLRAISPLKLVPTTSLSRIYFCRSTTGTLGKPTAAFWTYADWRALAETTARLLGRHKPPVSVVAFNGYNQGHLAAMAYDGAIRLLGGYSVPRHYLLDDEQATLSQIKDFRCNTLVLAERGSARKTGRTLTHLLKFDPKFLRRNRIDWWIGSSTTFTSKLRKIAEDNGVTSVTNLYGSSEFGMLAVSCKVRPEEFHLALGHVFVEVVNPKGFPVGSGKRGRIVVTHLMSSHEEGGRGPHEGTQMIRLANGDEATFLSGSCECGLNSPRITEIRRLT